MFTNPHTTDRIPPDWPAIRPRHVRPAMADLRDRTLAELGRLEALAEPSWAGVMEPLEAIRDRLARRVGAVRHLLAVRGSECLRRAYADGRPELMALAARLGRSVAVYGAVAELRRGLDEGDEPSRRAVEAVLAEMRTAGVELGEADRRRLDAVRGEMARLAARYSDNLRRAAGGITLRDPEDVRGLPEPWRRRAARLAADLGERRATADRGPWRVGPDRAGTAPFLERCPRRELRRRLYLAHLGRASRGSIDNGPVAAELLRLRWLEARLLGFASHAERMAAHSTLGSVQRAEALLSELLAVARPRALREHEELCDFALDKGGPAALEGGVQAWDIDFWAGRMRAHRLGAAEPSLAEYFPLPRVLDGLFGLLKRLLGVRVRAADGRAPTWHRDVRFFVLQDEDGHDRGAFYLDALARPRDKRDGCWTQECASGTSRAAGGHRPIVHVVCNFAPGHAGAPPLLEFDQVRALFHELGHALQHLLTEVSHGHCSGVRNLEWDAIELPSKFMERWCREPRTLAAISGHHRTGAPLPAETIEHLRASPRFRAGSSLLRQVGFGLIDLCLHGPAPPADAAALHRAYAELRDRTCALPTHPQDRTLCWFAHIFSGAYAGRYYAYKWSEVAAADAFAAFEELGDDQDRIAALGRRFRSTVLAAGGGRAPMDAFGDFRGRSPEIAAMLREQGL